jgi:hypothetical protein
MVAVGDERGTTQFAPGPRSHDSSDSVAHHSDDPGERENQKMIRRLWVDELVNSLTPATIMLVAMAKTTAEPAYLSA